MSIAGWIIWTVCLSPIWGSLVWHLWSHDLRPRLIPKDRIEKMTASLIAAYGDDAAEMAFIEEDAAWWRGEVFEQGPWRQLRRRIERGVLPPNVSRSVNSNKEMADLQQKWAASESSKSTKSGQEAIVLRR